MKRGIIYFVALTALCCAAVACLPQGRATAVESQVKLAQDDCLTCHGNQAFLLANRQQFMALEAVATEHDAAAEGEMEEEPASAEDLAAALYVDLGLMADHGTINCSTCHTAVNKEDAQTPNWHAAIITDPTSDGGQVCASCHGQEMIDNFKVSLHFTLNGVAKGLCERLEQTPGKQELFDEIINDQEPYMGCNTCHATCGQCHVSNPNITGGGLLNNHAFGKPIAETTCNPCHYENSEYHLDVDVHATKLNMSCVDCHSDPVEFHGRPLGEMQEGKLYYQGPDSKETGMVEPDMKQKVVKVTCVQ